MLFQSSAAQYLRLNVYARLGKRKTNSNNYISFAVRHAESESQKIVYTKAHRNVFSQMFCCRKEDEFIWQISHNYSRDDDIKKRLILVYFSRFRKQKFEIVD